MIADLSFFLQNNPRHRVVRKSALYPGKSGLRNTQSNAETGGFLSFEGRKDDPPESFRDNCPIPTVKKTDLMA
jgi:hypothetical protein